jgi:hypothetical protein
VGSNASVAAVYFKNVMYLTPSHNVQTNVVTRRKTPIAQVSRKHKGQTAIRQVSWLPGHNCGPTFPVSQWYAGAKLAGYSCGNSAGFPPASLLSTLSRRPDAWGADRGVLCWVQAARLSDFESAGFFGSREGREGAKYAKIQRWPEGPFHIPLPFKFAGQEFVGATRGFAQSPSRSSLLRALRVK